MNNYKQYRRKWKYQADLDLSETQIIVFMQTSWKHMFIQRFQANSFSKIHICTNLYSRETQDRIT